MSEFLHMGGHGFYVWSSYGLFFAVLAWQVWQPLARHRRIRAELVEEEALRRGSYETPRESHDSNT